MRRAHPAAILLGLMAACSTTTPTTTFGEQVTVTSTTAVLTVPPGDAAEVRQVFDGDSFEAEVDGAVVEVRMLGMNAPEGHECHGDAARARLRDLLADTTVILVTEGDETEDRFGRLLRSVYANGQFVNATMVAEGHAVALQGGSPREPRLVTLSDDAFADRLGMWAPQACDESTIPRIRIDEIEYDPPGRDWQNKEEEWIEVRNDAAEEVALDGWILRDESSTHRYEFVAGAVLAPGARLRIRTGCGTDTTRELYWCADDAVWSNGGDTVILQTAAGTVVDRVRYEGDF